MKRIVLVLAALLFCAGAFAQDLPRIAVYVTGDVSDNDKKALGTKMLTSLINSKRYRGIERSNSFLAEIEKEQVKQRSGEIDDSQISELGRQFGVKFVCIADITPAFGEYQVPARIVDVETAEVVFIGESTSPLKNMSDLTQGAADVVNNMFGEQTKPEPKPQTTLDAKPAPASAPAPRKTGMSIGGGLFFAGDFGGGVRWGSGEQLATPYGGGGAYLFFDAVYAEAFLGYSAGFGIWASDFARNEPLPENVQRAALNVGVFGKYPIGLGSVKAFPLLGIDYEASTSAKLKLANEKGYYVFDGADNRYAASVLSALWVKFGGGADFGLWQTLYLRAELLYGVRMSNVFENEEAKTGVDGKPLPGHGLTLKAGMGLKF